MKWEQAQSAALLLVFAANALADDTNVRSAGVAPRKVAAIDSAALARRIDKWIDAKLGEEKIRPSPKSTDDEFIRRVWLDLVGVVPPVEKVVSFLESNDSRKREKVVDELLADQRFGQAQADLWQDVLLTRAYDMRRISPTPLTDWLADRFHANRRWDETVREILTATGTQAENGATTFFLAHSEPSKANDVVSRAFLGLQLQCAQCHDHPFTGWKRTDYWSMAAFYFKVRATLTSNDPTRNQIVEANDGRLRAVPEMAKQLQPRFLFGEKADVGKDGPYRPTLAKWVTAEDNPFFARAFVNRTWATFFGRGFTNPIDDMHDGNACSHPELLRELSDQFVANGTDVKHLVRAICCSEAYQRTSRPGAEANDERDVKSFARMSIKLLRPEQLFDSFEAVAGVNEKERSRPRSLRIRPFVATFQVEEGSDPTRYQHGIPQVLSLMNSLLKNRDNRLVEETLQENLPIEKAIDRLFLGTLARRPTDSEREKFVAHVQKKSDKRGALTDVLWALLNSSAFTFNP